MPDGGTGFNLNTSQLSKKVVKFTFLAISNLSPSTENKALILRFANDEADLPDNYYGLLAGQSFSVPVMMDRWEQMIILNPDGAYLSIFTDGVISDVV